MATRFDFPRALAAFLDRDEVYRELQKVTNNPLDLRSALLERAWALEPDDPADGSSLPGRNEPTPRRELELLRFAQSGKATYTTSLHLTRMGHAGLWDMEQVGEKAISPYVAHGGFDVDRWGVFKSRLTPAGEKRLVELEATVGRSEDAGA